jgi:hypothetical protein
MVLKFVLLNAEHNQSALGKFPKNAYFLPRTLEKSLRVSANNRHEYLSKYFINAINL